MGSRWAMLSASDWQCARASIDFVGLGVGLAVGLLLGDAVGDFEGAAVGLLLGAAADGDFGVGNGVGVAAGPRDRAVIWTGGLLENCLRTA